ncbi:MAG: YbaK/EbsC family protein [Tepidisphaeraceae bacterium]
MATRRIREFLIGNKIPYSSINHTCAYTAQEVAESSHVPGRCMAKVVVVWLDGKLAIVVVPATKVVDLAKLRRETGTLDARLAEEADFRDRFSDCQVGTVPPFGNLFGLETFLDRQMTNGEQFAFNAGTHRDIIVIQYSDYSRLVKPRIVDVAAEAGSVPFIAKSPRPASRTPRAGSRTRCEDVLPATESAVQAECGSPITHHSGAD